MDFLHQVWTMLDISLYSYTIFTIMHNIIIYTIALCSMILPNMLHILFYCPKQEKTKVNLEFPRISKPLQYFHLVVLTCIICEYGNFRFWWSLKSCLIFTHSWVNWHIFVFMKLLIFLGVLFFVEIMAPE